jgi:outer membrane protein assembly factor BamB
MNKAIQPGTWMGLWYPCTGRCVWDLGLPQVLFVLTLLAALALMGAEVSLGADVELRAEWQLDLKDLNLLDAARSSPTVWDVDDDGQSEIIIAYSAPDDRLACVSCAGEVEWTYPPLSETPLVDDVVSTPMVYDIDGDWLSEIVFGTADGFLYCIDGRGTLEWSVQMAVVGPVVSWDATGDGLYELFFGGRDERIHSLDHLGNTIWESPPLGGGVGGAPVLWDLDQDGSTELIAGSEVGNVYCLGAEQAMEKWRFMVDAPINTTPVVVDANQDGEYEVMFGNEDGEYFCISFYGTELWRFTTGSSIRMSPSVGDVDGDGNKEVVLMNDNMLYCVDTMMGADEWTFQPANPWAAGNQMVLGDVTGDGRVDIVTGRDPLYVLDGNGVVQTMFSPSALASLQVAPAICDLDNDGEVEIVAKFHGDDLYVLTTGGTYHPETMIWPTAFRNRVNNQMIPMQECGPWDEEISRLFSLAFRHMEMAEEAGMDMERMRNYYSVAENFWRDCDYNMTLTYLEGILETVIPESLILNALGGLLLSVFYLSSLAPGRRNQGSRCRGTSNGNRCPVHGSPAGSHASCTGIDLPTGLRGHGGQGKVTTGHSLP